MEDVDEKLLPGWSDGYICEASALPSVSPVWEEAFEGPCAEEAGTDVRDKGSVPPTGEDPAAVLLFCVVYRGEAPAWGVGPGAPPEGPRKLDIGGRLVGIRDEGS